MREASVSRPVVFANAKHVELVVPAREIGERGVRRIALPDAAAVDSFSQLEGVLYARSIAPNVSADGVADDGIDLARVWRPNRKHQSWFSRAFAPGLVCAKPAAVGEPVAFDLPGLAEGTPALVRFSNVIGHFSTWAVAIVTQVTPANQTVICSSLGNQRHDPRWD